FQLYSLYFFLWNGVQQYHHSFPTRRSSDLTRLGAAAKGGFHQVGFHPTGLIGAFGCALAAARLLGLDAERTVQAQGIALSFASRSEEHTSELQSRENLVCRLLLEKKKNWYS